MVTWNPTEFVSWPIVEYLAWCGSKMLNYIKYYFVIYINNEASVLESLFQILLTWQASIFQHFWQFQKN
jgi:hypothetical protein